MGRGIATKTHALIEASAAILAEIQPATVRAVCYRLFTQVMVANMSKSETDRVSRALTLARERGRIPWEWIVDDTRHVEQNPSWADPDAFMDVVKRTYRKDRWQDQPARVLVVSEKGTVAGLLKPVLRAYGVGFLVLHGFGSATALNDLAAFSVDDDRPLSLLYVGDHDPSGRYMSDRDIPERLAKYGGQAKLIRLAVTPEQIGDFGLPTFAAATKAKDARYSWFNEHHGTVCCELDALSPVVLRQIVEGAIAEVIDWPRWNRADLVEHAEIESLGEFLACYESIFRQAPKYPVPLGEVAR